MMSPLVLRGRCACGRAEYAVHAAQLDAAVCYCATCRRSSGGAGMAWLTADRATLRVNGELQTWRSSDHASRQFCPHCATQLFCLEDDAPPEIKVAAGTLDDQKLVKSTHSAFVNERPLWDARHTLAQHEADAPSRAAEPAPGDAPTGRPRAEADAAFQSALASSPDAFISIDPDGLITEWNPQATATLGWSYAEAIRRPLHELIIPPEMRSAHLRGMSRLQRTGDGPVLGRRFEVDAIHKRGHRVPIELFVAPLRMAGGTGATAFVRDVSVRRAAEASIERAIGGEPVSFEVDLRLGGRHRAMTVRVTPRRNEHGTPDGFLIHLEDAAAGDP
jgi:PAS domain S-box-containing protein